MLGPWAKPHDTCTPTIPATFHTTGQSFAPLVDLVTPALLCGNVALAGAGPTAAPASLAAGTVTVLAVILLLATLSNGPVKQREKH